MNIANPLPAASLTLLVTGGAGFIGSCFVAQAVAKGFQVIVLDALTYAGHQANLEWISPSTSGGAWKLVKGNINDRALVSTLLKEHRISRVVNFAAESHVDNSIAAPASFIDTNVNGVFQLLEACRDYWGNLTLPSQEAFRFLQVSTDEVYGSLGPTGSFDESSPLHPNSPYSASKAGGDHLALAWFTTYGLPVVVTRCGNNYGPRQHPEKLIPHMITCALSGEKLPIYGDGKNIRDWLYVEDHCDGLWLALDKGNVGEIYHLGMNQEIDNLSLVNMICQLLDQKHPKSSGHYTDNICFVADRPGHDRRYALNTTKAQKGLGFAPQHKLENGIAATIGWYLSNRAWYKLRA